MELSRFSGNIDDVDFVNLLMVDIAGNIRSVSLPHAYATKKVLADGVGFDASNYGYAKIENSDMIAIPDLSTAFVEARGGFKMLHVLCDVVSTEHETFDQYPRNVIRNTKKYLHDSGVADDAKMLVEIEHYVFEDVKYSTGLDHAGYSVVSSEGFGEGYSEAPRVGVQAAYQRMVPEDRYMDFRNQTVSLMEVLGIPVKYHHHEVAISQLEIELDFCAMEKAADNVALAKWIIRQVASEMGLCVTFMPKPLYKMAGNGLHVHQYLEKNGQSTFPGEALFNLSPDGLSYIAGQLSQPHRQPAGLRLPQHQQLPPPRARLRSAGQRHLREGFARGRRAHPRLRGQGLDPHGVPHRRRLLQHLLLPGGHGPGRRRRHPQKAGPGQTGLQRAEREG